MNNNSESLINDAMQMIQNTVKTASFNISAAQPGGSLQDSLWNLYLDSQHKYQRENI